MLPQVKAIEPALKQVLYHCLEHVQATKAALYLSASHDLNEKQYEIVTSYQYDPANRRTISANDDLIDRLIVKRNAFFINGLGTDQKFAEMLFRQGSDRILATPLFSRGRLVGFIDMRDKAGRKPFDFTDVEQATKIAEKMLGVLASHNLFGVAAIQLVDEPARPAPPVHHEPEPSAARSQIFSADALRAIESARQHFSRRQLAQADKRAASNDDLDQLNLLLPSILAAPGAMLACFTTSAQSGTTTAAALGVPDEELVRRVETHLRKFTRRATHATVHPKLQFVEPFGDQLDAVTSAGITSIVTFEVLPDIVEGLLLTVAFAHANQTEAENTVKQFLEQLQPLLESALKTAASLPDRQLLAERLLEPDFDKYPELVEHSRTVSAIAHRFALLLELPPKEAETVRIAALVHDVGLRLLDYRRIYQKSGLTAEEMKGIVEHPVIGAALVEPVLGPEVAQAVLRHHERVDGKGYPSRLSGQQIPLTSRIVQIADAWVAMTGRQSYQPPIDADEAAARMRDAAGTQFDADLVERFLGAREQLLL